MKYIFLHYWPYYKMKATSGNEDMQILIMVSIQCIYRILCQTDVELLL